MTTYLQSLKFNNNDTNAVERVLNSLVNDENTYRIIFLKGGYSSGKTTFLRLLERINSKIVFVNDFGLDDYYTIEEHLNQLKNRMTPFEILHPNIDSDEQINTGNLTPPYPISFLLSLDQRIYVIETHDCVPNELLQQSIIINFEHQFPSSSQSGFSSVFDANIDQYANESIQIYKTSEMTNVAV